MEAKKRKDKPKIPTDKGKTNVLPPFDPNSDIISSSS